MRKELFAASKNCFIEEDLKDRNARCKRSAYTKKELKRANKKIRNIGKNIDVDYLKSIEDEE